MNSHTNMSQDASLARAVLDAGGVVRRADEGQPAFRWQGQAADDTIPTVGALFWAFRIMVGLVFAFVGVPAYFFCGSSFRGQTYPRWALWAAVIALSTPWIAAETEWDMAEFGGQLRVLDDVLSTALSASHLSVADLLLALAGFMGLCTSSLRCRDGCEAETNPQRPGPGRGRDQRVGRMPPEQMFRTKGPS
ncbi:cytochrome ubiquinol oxidase subunit I [Primorskyibacter sp. S187A]|uniref:cytochrome ubiquinol oxidase subunit I n=1 Tax=Primorskyibacter sp. S187A TaxID=3415130 RepID=UPI003C798608